MSDGLFSSRRFFVDHVNSYSEYIRSWFFLACHLPSTPNDHTICLFYLRTSSTMSSIFMHVQHLQACPAVTELIVLSLACSHIIVQKKFILSWCFVISMQDVQNWALHWEYLHVDVSVSHALFRGLWFCLHQIYNHPMGTFSLWRYDICSAWSSFYAADSQTMVFCKLSFKPWFSASWLSNHDFLQVDSQTMIFCKLTLKPWFFKLDFQARNFCFNTLTGSAAAQ